MSEVQQKGPLVKLQAGAVTEAAFKGNAGEPIFYANIAQVLLSADDACLLFAVRDTHNPESVQRVARVYLSLSHLKRMGGVIAGQIAAYESVFGTITADPAAKIAEQVEFELDSPEAMTKAAEFIRKQILERHNRADSDEL